MGGRRAAWRGATIAAVEPPRRGRHGLTGAPPPAGRAWPWHPTRDRRPGPPTRRRGGPRHRPPRPGSRPAAGRDSPALGQPSNGRRRTGRGRSPGPLRRASDRHPTGRRPGPGPDPPATRSTHESGPFSGQFLLMVLALWYSRAPFARCYSGATCHTAGESGFEEIEPVDPARRDRPRSGCICRDRLSIQQRFRGPRQHADRAH